MKLKEKSEIDPFDISIKILNSTHELIHASQFPPTSAKANQKRLICKRLCANSNVQ